MKKLVIAALPIGALIVAAPAWADNNLTNPGVGDKGYCSQPGCIQKQTGGPGSDAQNGTGAASGAFGAFGPGNPGGTYNAGGGSAGGANVPGTTGYNNSNVSGNSAGPGTQPTPRK